MSSIAGGSSLPIYRASYDFEALYRDYPPPDVFEQTVFRWPRERLRAFQNMRFMKLMEIGWNNGFYSRLWRGAGLEPGDIQSLDDIARLPAFINDDIKTDQQEHPPFGLIHGDIRALLHTMPVKLQTSGGTTGRPRPTAYGPQEWEMNGLTQARALYMHGARPGDILQIPATCSLANLAWGAYKACHDFLGVLPVTTGSGVVTSSRRQLEHAFDWGTNFWIGFPEYFTQLAKVCRDELGRDVRELNTKAISTFLGPDLENTLRRQIEELWGCPVYDNYGTHEMGLAAFECHCQNGLHLAEDSTYFEIVDVDTGQPVPPGAAGNLVVTILHRHLPPIIRFNVRDLARILSHDVCDCGGTFQRMDKFLGRSDDMVKLRGVNMWPMACLPAVRSDARTTGEWFCVVDRFERDGVIRDEMTVKVEIRANAGALDGLKEHLEQRLKTDLGVGVDVLLVKEGDLAEEANLGREGKPRRLLDRRFTKK